MKLYVLFGIPASGKTSLSHRLVRQYGFKVHSYDDTYMNMRGHCSSSEIKKQWIEAIKSDLLLEHDVVCDCMCLKLEIRRWILNQLVNIPCHKILIIIPTSVEECVIRNSKRDNATRVSENYIRALAKYMQPPTKDEGWDEILIYKD